MTMKQVTLSPEESKEFVELLEKSDDPEAIEKFLLGRSSGEVATELVPVLEVIEQLQKLQEDEISILAKCFQVRQALTQELTTILLNGPKDVKRGVELEVDTTEALGPGEGGAPAAETSPISTDQKIES